VQKIIQNDVWADALQADTRKILEAEGIMEADVRDVCSRFAREWLFGRATKAPGAWIIAMGIRMDIHPPDLSVMPIMPGDDQDKQYPVIDFDRWVILGNSKKILTHRDWKAGSGSGPYEMSLDQKIAAQCHRRLLRHLFSSWEWSLTQAIESGAAHIMARKQSVLVPFERITWNQWQYFRLDEQLQPPKELKWGEPRLCIGDWLPWTATGPGGEKLYEIHIAPGSRDRNREKGPEENCLKWLSELACNYPDRPPKPRDVLGKEAISKFPGLTAKGFLRCWARVTAQNPDWRRPGAPRKSPQQT
jgi:hypothetical protein